MHLVPVVAVLASLCSATAHAALIESNSGTHGHAVRSGPTDGRVWRDVELLVNGSFGTGTLSGWDVRPPAAVPQWRLSTVQIGTPRFGPTDGTPFATTMTRGGYAIGVVSTLGQLVALPDRLAPTLRVGVDTYASFDAIAIDVRWFADAAGSLEWVAETPIVTNAGTTMPTRVRADVEVMIPQGATHFVFLATARLDNGTWLDAGFANASVVGRVLVPEPGVAGLLAWACVVALRRRRAGAN